MKSGMAGSGSEPRPRFWVEDCVGQPYALGLELEANLGRIPRSGTPLDPASGVTPRCSKGEESLHGDDSPSMPVISWKLTSLREPSENRAIWTITSTAEACSV